MAFESSNIQSVKTPSGGTVIGWREDLVIGDTLVLSLTNTSGVSSYEWLMIGRPEGSVAGGTGPEPVSLGNGSSATFVVDDDSTSLPRDGTYIVACRINAGAPNETIKTVGLARNNSATIDGETLRLLGGFETFEDTSQPLTRQGYNTMLNRLLRKGIIGAAGLVINEGWNPNHYYAASNMGWSGTTSLTFSALGHFGSLIALPQTFKQAGNITTLAGASGNPTSGTNRVLFAIYRSKTGALYQPGALAHAFECSGGGFNAVYRETGLSIPVAAGEQLWMVWQAKADSDASLNIPAAEVKTVQGYDWDGVASPSGITIHTIMGYNKAAAYAFPPPDPFPAISEPTDLMLASFGPVPVFVWKFAPT